MKHLLRIMSYYIVVFCKRLGGIKSRLYNGYVELYLIKKRVIFTPSELKLYGRTYFYIGKKTKLKIGRDFIVRSGATAGIDVGAGSVVIKDIGEGEIWGGSPARFIKKV